MILNSLARIPVFWSNRDMRFLPVLLFVGALAGQIASASEPVTFNRQIAPIIYRNCSPCHHPGEAAPFP